MDKRSKEGYTGDFCAIHEIPDASASSANGGGESSTAAVQYHEMRVEPLSGLLSREPHPIEEDVGRTKAASRQRSTAIGLVRMRVV